LGIYFQGRIAFLKDLMILTREGSVISLIDKTDLIFAERFFRLRVWCPKLIAPERQKSSRNIYSGPSCREPVQAPKAPCDISDWDTTR
jgi:hypothetical protein